MSVRCRLTALPPSPCIPMTLAAAHHQPLHPQQCSPTCHLLDLQPDSIVQSHYLTASFLTALVFNCWKLSPSLSH